MKQLRWLFPLAVILVVTAARVGPSWAGDGASRVDAPPRLVWEALTTPEPAADSPPAPLPEIPLGTTPGTSTTRPRRSRQGEVAALLALGRVMPGANAGALNNPIVRRFNTQGG